MKVIVCDLDNTISHTVNGDYTHSRPDVRVIERLAGYKAGGFRIVISTSRNMRTFQGNVGEINVHTLPLILRWLDENDVPYDEVLVGKPWCGHEGFYVDDKAVRPDEFVNLSYDELRVLTSKPNDLD